MIPYLKRRFVPAPERFATVAVHGVLMGDRVDLLAATHLGYPGTLLAVVRRQRRDPSRRVDGNCR